jgi:hypothetical protein
MKFTGISGKRAGQALVEVTIATMIAAMTTMSVFSVVLSAMVSQQKADKREAAALVLKQAQEVLKSYVSADPLNGDFIPGIVDGYGLTLPAAPKSTSVGHWIYDTTGGWALAAGPHNIDSLLAIPPNPVTFPLAGGTLRYTVSDYDCGFGSGKIGNPVGGISGNTTCKIVVFTLTYPD